MNFFSAVQLLQQTTSQLGVVVERLGKNMVVFHTLSVADPRGHVVVPPLKKSRYSIK